ncbi:MAG: aspartate kinase [Pseudomonadota bacterium]
MAERERVVLKFGGTSVADLDRIRAVAKIVAHEADKGVGVVAVVSAMAGETNRLVALCSQAGDADPALDAHGYEYDTIVSSGEQVTAGLLALILQNSGRKARSWLGWQAPLVTDDAHGRAKIKRIDPGPIGAAIDGGEIAIVAGFQGIDEAGRISTLGRGGSDTTAAAFAAALDAARCDIYTDVDGVYTTDPRINRAAKKMSRIAYEEMLEMAALGAKVLQTRSVELAMAHSVKLRVLSSFGEIGAENPGTVICSEDSIVEKNVVSAVTLSRSEAKISLLSVPDHPGAAADIFTLLGDGGVNVDMIVQSPARSGDAANISFTMGEDDLTRAENALLESQSRIGFEKIISNSDVVKVSVIGVGMKSHTGVAATMFRTLADNAINIHNIATSEIKISVLIDSRYAELAVRALHTAYGLDAAA